MTALALDVSYTAIANIGESRALLLPSAPAVASQRVTAAATALRKETARHDIAITRRPSGRPRLEAPLPELGVSLSVRDGHLLVGFSPTHTVGADIEVARSVPQVDVARLARDHYTATEAGAVAALRDGDAAHDLFLRLWVAKEAVLKATGRGVFDGLDQLDFGPVLPDLLREGSVVGVREKLTGMPFRVAVRRLRAPAGARQDDLYGALAVAEG